jgi:hypothetical protein
MDVDEARRRLAATRAEAGLGQRAELVGVEERYIEIAEGREPAKRTVSVVRAWCGTFREGLAQQEHAIDPAGRLVRVRKSL